MNDNQNPLPVIPFKPQNDPSVTTATNQEELIAKAEDLVAPKKSKTKILLTTLVAFLLLGSIAGAVFLVRQNQDIRKFAADGDSCEYGQACETNGTQSCSGTIQGGTCKYDPGVDPNCSVCGTCGNGTCDGGEGHDNCPQDCPVNPPPGDNCCSGTTTCPSGQQCLRTSNPACSTCQTQPGNLPGCCNSDTDCAHWETCQSGNAACTSGKSCHSTAGCKIDSDCLVGNKCVGGTCIGSGSLECSADSSGVSINNKTDKPVSGTATYFSKWCNDSGGTNCFCGGTPTSVAVTLQPGESWSRGIVGNGPPTNCAWQSDLTFPGCDNANHGCETGCSTPTNTPTPTPVISCQCGQIKAYDTTWKLLTSADLATLKAGDKVRFTVSGTATSGTIDKSRFKVNGGTYAETVTKKSATQEFYYEYTIPANVTSFSVEAQVHHAGLNQWF
jgi:hypothetical protein